MDDLFKPVRFYIGDKEYTNEELLFTIPYKYRNWFEGRHFRDGHHLSMARMFASCADEAERYHKTHLLVQNEIDLKATLEM